MNSTNQHSAPTLRYQPAVPVPSGKLALWLFLSTEIMFFTALIGSYIVLRFGSPEGTWPTPSEVHVVEWMGAVNTFVLLCSSVTIVFAHESARQNLPAVAKKWLWVTIGLGCLFLGIKSYEYASKYEHGIYPRSPRSLMYDRADLRYLDGVKAETSLLIRSGIAADTKDSTEQGNIRTVRLQQILSGLVKWTETVVGRTNDPLMQQLAIESLAYQIYPESFSPPQSARIEKFMHDEAAENQQNITEVQATLSESALRLKDLQNELTAANETAKQAKKDSSPAEQKTATAEARRLKQAATAATTKVTELTSERDVLAGRIAAVKEIGDSHSQGQPESHHLRSRNQ